MAIASAFAIAIAAGIAVSILQGAEDSADQANIFSVTTTPEESDTIPTSPTPTLTSTCNEELLQEFRAAVRLENLKELDVISLLANCPHMDQDTLNKGSMYNGKTALYLASHEGHVELVQALLEQDNIDVNKGRESRDMYHLLTGMH